MEFGTLYTISAAILVLVGSSCTPEDTHPVRPIMGNVLLVVLFFTQLHNYYMFHLLNTEVVSCSLQC